MTFLDPKQSLIDVTGLMYNKQKFSYINIPKAAVVALSKNSDNSFPSSFAKNVIQSLKSNDKRIMKAISHTLKDDVAANRHRKIGLSKDSNYYYSNIFEYFYLNDRETFNSFVDHFIRYSKTAIVTFHDSKAVSKFFGHNVHNIHVPYNNYYNKVDDVYAQIAELEEDLDYCLLDCGVMGLALLPKVWQNLNVPLIDFGKTLTLGKVNKNQ